MTVVLTAIFHPSPGASADLILAMEHAIPLVHEEQGCLLYCINEAPDGTIVMVENWESAEDLDSHAAGSVVANFKKAIEGLLERPVAVTKLRAIPIGDPAKGAL